VVPLSLKNQRYLFKESWRTGNFKAEYWKRRSGTEIKLKKLTNFGSLLNIQLHMYRFQLQRTINSVVVKGVN
jgi:hypothetical protein